MFFLSVGDDTDRESSPFLREDTDTEHHHRDKNMALFEVPVTDDPRSPLHGGGTEASWSLQRIPEH